MGIARLFFKRFFARQNNVKKPTEESLAMHPITTVRGAIVTGFVVAIVIALIITSTLAGGGAVGFHHAQLDRWFHILAGVMWIGLLWYFNVVQVPGLADAAADKGGPGGAGVSKYIAPRALFWFRWAAVVTWVTGAYFLMFGYGGEGALHKAFTFQPGFVTIGVGAWLGTIMLFNVWVFIWPNQKKILGLAPATDDEKAKARKVALWASRINFILSVPMLMCMGGQSHGLPF
jgi:uncharacterized membrane protein